MKKITLFIVFVACFGLLQAQTSPDYIFGDGNGSTWTWTTGTQGTASLGGSYLWKFKATAAVNEYFKIAESNSTADGAGYWVNGSSSDMQYTGAGAKWTAYYKANMGDGGAVYWTMILNNYYVIKTKLNGSDADFAIFDNGTTTPVTISSVVGSFSSPNLLVDATLSAVKSANEKVWIRFTTNNWVSSSTVEASTNTSGNIWRATIPLTGGELVKYYAYTTIQQVTAPAETDADFYTVSYNNNSGVNYTYKNGSMSGNYYIGNNGTAPGGTNPDFNYLKQACDALNTSTISGDVNLYITSNLTEPVNCGLGVNTNSHNITIRPDQDVDRTITFTQLADNSSPTGHLVIGYLGTGLSAAWSDANTIATNNVTIDGYAPGGSTRRLIITNTNASHTGARVIMVIGACTNTVIKNCIINNLTTHTGSPFCVGAVVRKGTAIDVAPNGFTVDNNVMTAIGNNVAMGMRITNSNVGATNPTTKLTGLVIKNNTITARRRLIEINYTDGGDINNNEFKTQQTGAAGTVSYGVWTSTAVIGTLNIFNNKFTEAFTEETGAFGHRVISLASAATYNIYNNMFTGLNKTKPSTVALNLAYLFYSGVAGKIYNNTFYMPALTDPSSTGYYNAIQLSGNTAEIKNNIFISDEPTHTNTAFISAIPTPASDYNDFYLRQSHTGSKIVSTYTTLGDYQTANPTKDINSKSKNANFVSSTDLSLTGTSIGDTDLAADAIGTPVLTDIFGAARHTPKVYMGAHEPSNLNLGTSVDNTNTSTRIMRTSSGIAVTFDGNANVELYNINGALIEKTKANGSYSRDLNNGVYIIRINGKSTKFVK